MFNYLKTALLLTIVAVSASDDFSFRIENTIANYTNYTLSFDHAYIFHHSSIYTETVKIDPNTYFKTSMQNDYFFSENLSHITLMENDEKITDCNPKQVIIKANIPQKAVTLMVTYTPENETCLVDILE